MTQPFPHRYETLLVAEGETRAALSSGARPVLVGGAPPEFDGDPGVWSPEHLLLSAANLCLWTTVKVLARKVGLEIDSYRSLAEGILEKTREGIVFTRIALDVSLRVPSARVEEARALLETAKKYCIISNSLKRPVELRARVEPLAERAEAS